MDLQKIIHELEVERQRLDEAIQALERLSAGKAKKRGRPPLWLKDDGEEAAENQEPAEAEARQSTKLSSG